MSLTAMHETVLHVVQMHPKSWEMGGILTGSPCRGSSAAPPSHSGTGNPLRIDPPRLALRRCDTTSCCRGAAVINLAAAKELAIGRPRD